MLFNSIEFLFVFLPVVIAGFLLLSRLASRTPVIVWLTFSSLFFYGWWNPVYLLLIAASMGANYGLGRWLASGTGNGRLPLGLGLAFNLGLLGYFKYFNFFVDNANLALGTSIHFETIVLPLAISFYTFQQITYLVDTRKGLTEEHGFLEYALFVTFFPQLIAGPIVHHSEMLAQFRTVGSSRDVARNLAVGTSIVAVGLFKKAVVADGFAVFSDAAFGSAAAGQTLHAADALVGIFAYAFQLYFDFSGYSDMAIGLGCLFGIKLPVNFFSPYRAQNIGDFWRTWNATLSRFLRDYVYSPLGGFVCSPNRQRFNLFATMFLGGVWHGAGWTFIVYGILHGSYVVIHQLWRVHVSGPLGLVVDSRYKAVSQAFTFLVVVFTLVFFRAETLGGAFALLGALAGGGGAALSSAYASAVSEAPFVVALGALPGAPSSGLVAIGALGMALFVCWFLPNTLQIFQSEDVFAKLPPRAIRPTLVSLRWRANLGWSLAIALLLVASFLTLSEVSPFLYFQF